MWRAYFGLIRKEFIQIRHDKNMLRIIFLMPVIQLLLLGYAVNTDVKYLEVDLYDYDRSELSRKFTQSLSAGNYFITNDMLIEGDNFTLWELSERFKRNESELAIIIPPDFSKEISKGSEITTALIADGSNANSAATGIGYAMQIVNQFSQNITGFSPPIKIRHTFLYNRELESVYYMIPGIIATLLTMVTVTLTSMAIVREREIGTLEQLTVTPISGTVLLLGKTSSFAILGIIEMLIALTVGVLWFGIPFIGSPLLLALLSLLFLITTLGIGLFFSTVTSTQQQAMFLAWFFSTFAILTSGFFTPIANMPDWMQIITHLNPMRYYMVIVRGIMMKGSGFFDLLAEISSLAVYSMIIFGLAALRFTKRTT